MQTYDMHAGDRSMHYFEPRFKHGEARRKVLAIASRYARHTGEHVTVEVPEENPVTIYYAA